MFDEMTFKARKIDYELAKHIIDTLSMVECTRGESVYYQTTEADRFNTVHATLCDGKLVMRVSIHKLWALMSHGALDNSGLLSMEDACATIMALMNKLHMDITKVVSDKFEVGICMTMAHNPQDYISQMISIGETGKETFIDALYQKDRQRTTTKVRSVKKVLKVYDKTYEYETKGKDVGEDILRCETIYRRQNVKLDHLLSKQNLIRLQTAYWRDWSSAVFHRTIKGTKGTKASQLEKATCIMTEGLDNYRMRMRNAYMQRAITKKTWETIRVFCDRWSEYQDMFVTVPSEQEKEYRTNLKACYDQVILH